MSWSIKPCNSSRRVQQRLQDLQHEPRLQADFEHEMRRFLPPDGAKRTVENPQFWVYVRNTVLEEGQRVLQFLRQGGAASPFQM